MVIQISKEIRIPEKKLEKIIQDPVATAKAVKLVYVNDKQEGIQRVKRGKSFSYVIGKKALKDKDQMARIKSLVLPPAWENVWICKLENGHLQATGLDAMKRKQYRYHTLWNALRNQTKFYRMLEFGKALPKIRKQVNKDLREKGITKRKVLATVVSLMEETSIRIGNESYEKLYGSFGLTTLKDKHVDIKGGNLKFSFRGKKGVEHSVTLKSRKLAHIVRQCRDIPGKELFQYYDEEGNKQTIDSGMVNDYIRELVGGDFTAKDFRTWSGTVQCLLALKDVGPHSSATDARKKIVEVLDKVAQHLGNTRTVCKKYYVHPCLLDMFEKEKLYAYLAQITPGDIKPSSGLSSVEKLLLQILRNQ